MHSLRVWVLTRAELGGAVFHGLRFLGFRVVIFFRLDIPGCNILVCLQTFCQDATFWTKVAS